MKRTVVFLSIVALMAFTTGCRKDDDCNFCNPYCDDSGCYNCDGSGCWLVENQPCESELQCAADEVCTEYGCARPCSFDSECGLNERCLPAGYCGPAEDIAQPCDIDDDCAHGMICEDNICIEGCTSDDECGTDEVCTSCGRCQPSDNPVCGEYKEYCADSAECGDGRVCTDLARCAYECDLADPVCPRGQVCADSVCIDDPAPANPECIYTVECADVPICETLGCQCVNQYCQPLCDTVEDCGFGQICDLGLCKANYRPEE